MSSESGPGGPIDLSTMCALESVGISYMTHHITEGRIPSDEQPDRLCIFRIDPENPIAICGVIAAYSAMQNTDPVEFESMVTRRGEAQCAKFNVGEGIEVRKRLDRRSFLADVVSEIPEIDLDAIDLVDLTGIPGIGLPPTNGDWGVMPPPEDEQQ